MEQIPLSNQLYSSRFCGLQVTTGDILCTRDGEANSLLGRLWSMLGRLAPGEIDHCLLYLGPEGRCIESGPKGVIEFEMPFEGWDARTLFSQRWILDSLYGAAYPLANLELAAGQEERIRLSVAAFCQEQAAHSKPYNLNYFNPQEDGAFYCSQLIYRAYLAEGIDLNTNLGVPAGPLKSIVFPQEIWNACPHTALQKS
ncbi:MAG TPA: hypothetical protein VF498_17165 [Anaerolineales bacterium]